MNEADFVKCLEIATIAHAGQKRWNGDPYISHPIAVAKKLDHWDLKCVAVLHDVLEDTEVTEQDLLNKGVPDYIVKVVKVLTKKPGEKYVEFIARIMGNYTAVVVKMADLEHNLSDLKPGAMRDKYELALGLLKRTWEEDQ